LASPLTKSARYCREKQEESQQRHSKTRIDIRNRATPTGSIVRELLRTIVSSPYIGKYVQSASQRVTESAE
jgi:hypothetical protein